MDTVLNLGLNDETVEALSAKTQNPRFAYDSYRRFICMFGNVVMGIEHSKFEHILSSIKEKHGRKFDCDLELNELKEVVAAFKQLFESETKRPFVTDPREQLNLAVTAVFASWNNPRAIYYRKINDIRGLKGTAVTVQEMVFGNTGNRSATGVGFTRNPATGEKVPYGEYLINAQGEDVVAGIRTPHPIAEMERELPEAFHQLMGVYQTLEVCSYLQSLMNILFSSATTAMCKILNLPLRTTTFTCCRPARASARPRLPSALRRKWLRRALFQRRKLSCVLTLPR